MKKKWFNTAALVGLVAVLSIPLMGFSSHEKEKEKERVDIELRSGGIGVPFGQLPPDIPAGLYHQPKDGIISGAIGCQPDVHVFDKSNVGMGPLGPETEHIVFTAGIKEISTQQKAEKLEKDGITIYVEISSNRHKILTLPFHLHETPDPNTNKPFWVSALYFEGDITGPGRTAVNLPTGEYSYEFKAKDKKGRVVDDWEPKNHKFTVVDSAVNK